MEKKTIDNNVNIYLKTTINQENDSEVFEFETQGQLLVKNGAIFLRYTEIIVGQNQTKVLIKLENTTMRINRHGDSLTKMAFIAGKRMPAHYQTPAGQMQLETYTTTLSSDINLTQLVGSAKVSYNLYANSAIVGQYDILLQFTEKSSKLN